MQVKSCIWQLKTCVFWRYLDVFQTTDLTCRCSWDTWFTLFTFKRHPNEKANKTVYADKVSEYIEVFLWNCSIRTFGGVGYLSQNRTLYEAVAERMKVIFWKVLPELDRGKKLKDKDLSWILRRELWNEIWVKKNYFLIPSEQRNCLRFFVLPDEILIKIWYLGSA